MAFSGSYMAASVAPKEGRLHRFHSLESEVNGFLWVASHALAPAVRHGPCLLAMEIIIIKTGRTLAVQRTWKSDLWGRCASAAGCRSLWRRPSGQGAWRSRRPGWPGCCWAWPAPREDMRGQTSTKHVWDEDARHDWSPPLSWKPAWTISFQFTESGVNWILEFDPISNSCLLKTNFVWLFCQN